MANLLNAAIRRDTTITDVSFKHTDRELKPCYPIFTPIPIFNRVKVTVYVFLDEAPDEATFGCAVDGAALSLHLGRRALST